jgi:hypothetical protein
MAAIAFLMKHNHKRRTETGREEGVDSPGSNRKGEWRFYFIKQKGCGGGGWGKAASTFVRRISEAIWKERTRFPCPETI